MNTIKKQTPQLPPAASRKFPAEAYQFEDDVTSEGVDFVRKKAAPIIEAEEWELIDGFDHHTIPQMG